MVALRGTSTGSLLVAFMAKKKCWYCREEDMGRWSSLWEPEKLRRRGGGGCWRKTKNERRNGSGGGGGGGGGGNVD